jgi:hypothetical protein
MNKSNNEKKRSFNSDDERKKNITLNFGTFLKNRKIIRKNMNRKSLIQRIEKMSEPELRNLYAFHLSFSKLSDFKDEEKRLETKEYDLQNTESLKNIQFHSVKWDGESSFESNEDDKDITINDQSTIILSSPIKTHNHSIDFLSPIKPESE